MLVDADGYDVGLPADCGLGCAPSWYVQAEALYFANESNGPVSLSNAFSLPEFSYAWGMRVTMGRRQDQLNRWEISYAGPFKWELAGDLRGPALTADLATDDDINISAFNFAQYHRQSYESSLHSIELNKRWDDWDTMSLLVGLRYFGLDEDYSFYSLGSPPLAEEGLFTVTTRNHLIGPQCGLDVMHPIGASNRLSVTAKTKLGAYANFADGDARLVNAGVEELNNDDEETEFAFQWELGFLANLQVTPRFSLRCGYEFWYLYGLALVPGQTVSPLSQSTLTNLDAEQDTWYHGAVLGGALVW
jgi:hypothetical protein